MLHPLLGWIPLDWDSKAQKFLCLKTEKEIDLSLPFFSQSIQKHLDSNTGAQLGQFSKLSVNGFPLSSPLSGMIFHASRCGSTLISQSLKKSSALKVIAEAPSVNAAIQLENPPKNLLRDIVNVLSQFYVGSRVILKHSSQCTLFLSNVLEVYPEIPWLFVYRHPVEIMVSVHKQHTGWSRSFESPTRSAFLLGIEEEQMTQVSFESYLAKVLSKFYSCALNSLNSNGLLINHSAINIGTFEQISKHFGGPVQVDEMPLIEKSLHLYSKDPLRETHYESDVSKKKAEASDAILEAAEEVIPLYELLESKRLKQPI